MQKLIDIRNVSKIYPCEGGNVYALNNVSLSVEEGEYIAIVGKSGSGKSTLMNMIGCLDVPTNGEYYLCGLDVSKLKDKELSKIRNQTIGFIFQGFNLISGLSAQKNVELPLSYRNIAAPERKSIALKALRQVGLGDRVSHTPSQMSGGQQQRVAVARAIAASPRIILADEPTGNLDSSSGREIIKILRSLNLQGRTVILITHDDSIAENADRIIRISDGEVISDTMSQGHLN